MALRLVIYSVLASACTCAAFVLSPPQRSLERADGLRQVSSERANRPLWAGSGMSPSSKGPAGPKKKKKKRRGGLLGDLADAQVSGAPSGGPGAAASRGRGPPAAPPPPEGPALTALGDRLLELCEEPERDLTAIAECVDGLSSMLPDPPESALLGSWRLAWVTSDAGISAVGTGLHNAPLTRQEDTFLTIEGGGDGRCRAVETIEVLRVIGPFPNVKNTLSGSCRATTGRALSFSISYDRMIDGLGNNLSGPQTRDVRFGVRFAGSRLLILEDATAPGDWLVFAREDALQVRLDKLGVIPKADKKS